MSRPVDAARAAGFSLLETLVAVAVLAMIAGLSLPALQAATRVEARLAEQVRAGQGHRDAEALLRHLLARAQPGETGGGLEGHATGLSFLSRPEGFDDLQSVSFNLGSGLVLSLGPVGEPQRAGPVSTRLSEGGGPYRLHYYGVADGERVARWHESWNGRDLPRLVVLDMPRRDGQVRRIEMLVGAQGVPACRFDSGRGRCLGVE